MQVRWFRISHKLNKTQILESGANLSFSKGASFGSGTAQTVAWVLGWAELVRSGLWLLPVRLPSFARARGAGRMGELFGFGLRGLQAELGGSGTGGRIETER